MTNFEQNVNKFFELCEKVNKAEGSIDIRVQKRGYAQIAEEFQNIRMYLESAINMGAGDLRNIFSDKKTLLKLYYTILKVIYVTDMQTGYFAENRSSVGSSLLAKKIMKDSGFYNTFSSADTWFRNDKIFKYGVMNGLRGVHRTSMQNIVRGMAVTLTYNEFMQQPVFNYMQRFEQHIFYYLNNANPKDRVVLDFV